ncbi:MAG: hypothetical protein H0T76_12790 [Nannocystis sp.]|nr:peptide-N-glycosidase F-related protein [Nannocystis sp.]MBA3547356.1 hypothetical protein [Nannocystis sp.]
MRPLLTNLCLLSLVAACGGTGGENDEGSTGEQTTGKQTTGEQTTGEPTTGESTTGEPTTGESTGDGPPPEPEVINVMENIVFYDGYAGTVDEPVPEGVVRHSNALHAIKLTEAQLAKIQNTLEIGVVVGALCDNYDRIGSVHLALVPKGAATYLPAEVQRMELARFITPFMNMNKSPMTVPYQYDANNVVPILKDEALRAEYDMWFELAIFGVPYAAQTEVAGCAGRIDTQLGSLLLYTDSKQEPLDFNVLLPLAIGQSFNNYAEGASDMLGITRKTLEFELKADTANAQLVLITSNHGANAGGEEYIRRDHFVGVDDALVLKYKPGRDSCEPFRKYNTQGNGIYGQSPKSDAEWQSFSNWCPGDVIDTRIIELGPVSAGVHEFVIEVPDAKFAEGQGDFPFSLYLQAQ